MARITHADRTFTGFIGPVQFVNGVADTDDHTVISYCVLAGHQVDQDEPEAEPEDDLDEDPEPPADPKPAPRKKS